MKALVAYVLKIYMSFTLLLYTYQLIWRISEYTLAYCASCNAKLRRSCQCDLIYRWNSPSRIEPNNWTEQMKSDVVSGLYVRHSISADLFISSHTTDNGWMESHTCGCRFLANCDWFRHSVVTKFIGERNDGPCVCIMRKIRAELRLRRHQVTDLHISAVSLEVETYTLMFDGT